MDNDYDIAIVGMSCRLPGARNLDEFWRNLAGGIESITRFSDQEILESGAPASCLSNPSYVKAAPVLEEPGHFDARFFGFSPMEAKTMDPQHRILLELADEALENAGYDANRYPGRVGVFTGAALNTYFMHAGLSRRFAEEYIPTLLGNDKDFLSTRISYKLNLKGPSLTVQTACSTSLVAVHLARQSLLSGETDMVLTGAISVRVPHRAGYFCDGGGIVSADGHVRAFDANANGTVFGSGGGILVLKRLADALADGDTVHAVIKGSAVNNDGSEKAGYSAPSVNMQADAVVEALANAGVEADSISYIEAHGSGTPVGDPIEIRALTKAFRTSTQRSGYCAIGSVKTNVGHLDAAAAVAGMIKTVLALKHRKLPPSLHFNEANPEIDFPRSPFYVNTDLREWISDGPRRAGVMSTGMGGTNAHVVLEEAPAPVASSSADPPHLLILSAKTETALDQATQRLRDFLSRNDSVNMSDVAYTLKVGRKAFAHRRCLVCLDREDAIAALGQAGSKRVLSGRVDDSRRPVILLLPGMGDHYVGMAHDLYQTRAIFRQEVDRCAQILERHLAIDIRTVIYPGSQSWKQEGKSKGIDLKKMLGGRANAPEDPDTRHLNTTLLAQPALFTIEYAMARLWQSLGITPDAIVGHSMGEYVAACLAGVFSLEDALRLIATRAKLVDRLPQGAMLAVTLPENELLPLLPESLSIALINGPRLCVVAGPVAAVAELEKMLAARGVICRHVQNAHAFHSRMLDPIVKAFEEEVKKVALSKPDIAYISNVSGTWITEAEATNPAYWAAHANHTARFSDALHALWQLHNPVLLEAGPGRTLGVLAMQHPDKNRAGEPAAIASIRHHYDNAADSEVLLQAVGQLWLAGVAVDWDNHHLGEKRRRISLPTYPFERHNYWMAASPDSARNPQEQGAPSNNPGLDDWFYVPTWERTPFPPARENEPDPQGASWLIIGDRYGGGASVKVKLDDLGVAAELVHFGERFSRRSDGSFELNPARIDDYLKLFRELQGRLARPLNILHLGGLTRDELLTTHSPSNQNFGFYSLLYMAQAIGELNVAVPIKLGVISNRVQEVTGEESLDPEMATLLGPCGVIPKELPNVTCFNIDLPDTRAIDDLADATLGKILSEFSRTHKSRVIAYRGRYRWERGYEQVRLPKPALSDGADESADSGRLRRGGVYLITGGTGGLGLVVAKYLATTCQARIVLTKKAAFPEKSTWRALATAADTKARVRRTLAALVELEDLGAEVEVLVADAANRQQMQRVRDAILARFGTIHGVIHAAGIVRAGLIQAKTKETADSVLAAKVHGTTILFDLLKDINPDFLILFSSITSVLTPYAESDYSAANAFLDAFGCFANAQGSFRTITINWPGWKEVGQLADLESLPGVEEWKEAALRKAIATEHGIEAFKRVLNSDLDHIIVSPESLGRLLEESQKPFDPAEYLSRVNHGQQAHPRHTRPRNGVDQPTSQVEADLAEIWRDVFGFEQIGIHDSFFELGGHSLLAIQIISRVRQVLSVNLPLRALFAAPTVAALAAAVAQFQTGEQKKRAAPDPPPILPRPHRDRAPLSFTQQRLWFLDRLEPGSTAYVLAAAYRLAGPLQVPALARSLNEIVRRHESLRTTLSDVDGEPFQVIGPSLAVPMPVLDLQPLAADQREAEVVRLAVQEARRPFDLAGGPLLRAVLLRLHAEEHVLGLTAHHIVSDGLSYEVLFRELIALYQAFSVGKPSPLVELPVQYADYAWWQREWMQGDTLEKHLSYWKRQLAGAPPVLALPADHPRPAVQTYRGGQQSLTLSRALTGAVKGLSQREGVTLFITLLAAFKALLYRYTAQEDIVVGTPIAGRNRVELEGSIGLFLSTVVLRTDLSGNPTFSQLLERVREMALEAHAHQELPFERLVEELNPERDLSRTPIFQVMFNHISFTEDRTRWPGFTVDNVPLPELTGSKFDLTLYSHDRGETVVMEIVYNADLFEAATVATLAHHLETLLAAVVAQPDARLSTLVLASEAERHALAIRPDRPFLEFESVSDNGSIPDRFRAMVALHADRTAVESGTRSWTYRELDAAAGRVARAVAASVPSMGSRVGLLWEHDAGMVAAILGVLISGNAYVPLDPLYPGERLAFMLQDAQASILLTNSRNLSLARSLASDSVRVINADELELAAIDPLSCSVAADAMAYILYTSGSTGEPKGVMQSHRNVLHHIRAYTNNLHISRDDRLSLLASFSFDAAVMDLFGALLNGATLCLLDVREEGVERLRQWVSQQRISIFHSTPTLYRAMLAGLADSTTFPAVRLVVLGGEEVVRADVESWRRRFPADSLLVNGLGPTESTVSFQHFLDRSSPLTGTSVPVGYPVNATELVLLDPEGQPSPLAGEIGIRSAYVALGYWRRPALTETAFLPDPDGGPRRIYRTGDLGRLRPDGTLEFLGRRDDQVKVRGFRIEPAEVEAVLDSHPGVLRSVVVARLDDSGGRYLAAYVIAAVEPAPSAGVLQAHVRERLPIYMVPSVFVTLASFPLTPSGKVDRRALSAPDRLDGPRRSSFVGPRTLTEEILAGIWAEVLRLEQLGVEDDFFELGGHSLLATQVVSRVRQSLGVELPLREFFAVPTIARVSARIEALRAKPRPALPMDELAWLARAGWPAGIAGNRDEVEL